LQEQRLKAAVCLCADQNYFPAACVTARRVFDLSRADRAITIIHDRVPDSDLQRARDFLGDRLLLVDMSRRLDAFAFPTDRRISRAAYLRLFLDQVPELADTEKLIYLDSDIYPHRDPFELIETDHVAGPLIAAHDLSQVISNAFRDRLRMTDGAPYFNSGVMLMHIPWIRESAGLERARQFVGRYPDDCKMHDQDALNHAFQDNWQTLDWRWNVVSDFFRSHIDTSQVYARHFTGAKPWQRRRSDMAETYIEAYLRMFAQSPWPHFFEEQSAMDMFRARRRRFLKEFEGKTKTIAIDLLGSRVAERHAKRLKLASQLGVVLDQLREDAAERRPARRWMERFVLSGLADDRNVL
jgi:lipopolysaccharide biosynthesis glycosyltransferase